MVFSWIEWCESSVIIACEVVRLVAFSERQNLHEYGIIQVDSNTDDARFGQCRFNPYLKIKKEVLSKGLRLESFCVWYSLTYKWVSIPTSFLDLPCLSWSLRLSVTMKMKDCPIVRFPGQRRTTSELKHCWRQELFCCADNAAMGLKISICTLLMVVIINSCQKLYRQ